jgi:hypothetical protein
VYGNTNIMDTHIQYGLHFVFCKLSYATYITPYRTELSCNGSPIAIISKKLGYDGARLISEDLIIGSQGVRGTTTNYTGP